MERASSRLAAGAAHVAAASIVLAAVAPAAFAAKGGSKGGGGGGGGTSTTGNDVSYPQCGHTLPTGEAFAVVGLNGGLANDLNPCFGPSATYPSYQQSELYWAVSSTTGASSQPRASLYVNTGDPGNMYQGSRIGDWPTSGGNATYGSCTTTTVTTANGPATVGQNSPACAWQYGYDRGAQDAVWLTQGADSVNARQSQLSVPDQAGAYPWWLDVESANSWQTGSSGQAMNVADLQGMVAALQAAGATKIGAYSTSAQWGPITGGTTTSASGSLFGMPDWVPGATTLSGAVADCSLASFTAGSVLVTQWVSRLDGDYSCRAWP